MSKIAGPMLKEYIKFMKSGQGFEHIVKNVKILTAKDGFCKAELTIQPEQANVFGFLHGGFSASLVDMISGLAVFSHKREGGCVSVNINLSYIKGAKIGDKISVEAKTIKAGKSLGFLEVEIKNKEGDILVRGTHTMYYNK